MRWTGVTTTMASSPTRSIRRSCSPESWQDCKQITCRVQTTAIEATQWIFLAFTSSFPAIQKRLLMPTLTPAKKPNSSSHPSETTHFAYYHPSCLSTSSSVPQQPTSSISVWLPSRWPTSGCQILSGRRDFGLAASLLTYSSWQMVERGAGAGDPPTSWRRRCSLSQP